MTHAAYVPSPAMDYADETPQITFAAGKPLGSDALGLSLRIAGVVSCLSLAAVVFGLARMPDIDLNSAPGQSAYIAQLDAAGTGQATQPDGKLLVLSQPDYSDASIVHAAPLPVPMMPAIPDQAVKVSATTVDGDAMSRLLHGADPSTDGADDAHATACNEPCEPVAYVDGQPVAPLDSPPSSVSQDDGGGVDDAR
ncbi:MAG: hypothetical protein ACXU8O_03555 [Asticcacaulis sp.]